MLTYADRMLTYAKRMRLQCSDEEHFGSDRQDEVSDGRPGPMIPQKDDAPPKWNDLYAPSSSSLLSSSPLLSSPLRYCLKLLVYEASYTSTLRPHTLVAQGLIH